MSAWCNAGRGKGASALINDLLSERSVPNAFNPNRSRVESVLFVFLSAFAVLKAKPFFNRWLDIEQIAVSGGHLDHSTDLETLREKGGYELVILLLNSAGKVSID